MISPMRLGLVWLVACGGAAATTSEPARPAADPAPCADVATHELQIMNLGFLGAEKTGQLKQKIEGHCRQDAWPTDVRRCVVTATGFDEMTACHDKLTAGQRTAYQQELRGSDEPAIPDVPERPPANQPPELLK